jgi:HEAT repeat protein
MSIGYNVVDRVAIVILLGALSVRGSEPGRADSPLVLTPEIRSLIKQTSSDDPKRRIEACTRLGEMGERAAPAVPSLICLWDDDATVPPDQGSVGYHAALALRAIGKPAVQPTIDALRGASARKRHAIAFMLSRLNDPRAIRTLLALFDDQDADVRAMAALGVQDSLEQNSSLAKLPGLVDSLIDALASSDPDVRRYVVGALGKSHCQRAFGPVLKMLKDSDATVRSDAISAIGAIGGRDAKPILLELLRNRKADAGERGTAAYALGSIDPAMVEVLMAVLADASEPPRLREAVAWTLGTMHDERAAPLLLKVVENKSERHWVRAAALEAFAVIQGRKAIPVLQEILWSKSYDAPAAASVAELVAAWRVRRLAAPMLVEITDGAIDDVRIVTIVARVGSEPIERARGEHPWDANWHRLKTLRVSGVIV